MANEELAEVLLSYKKALFPGNIKKIFQHRYFIQSRCESTSSDDSTFDLEDTTISMSLSNSTTKERSIVDLPSHSPSKSTTFKIKPSNAVEDNDVFVESADEQELTTHGAPEFSKMSFTQQEHPLTVGSELTTTKEQVNQCACLPTQKYSRSIFATDTEAEERHGFQHTQPPFPILHHHLPGVLSPQLMLSANIIPFPSIQEGCHMFFDFDTSRLLAGFIPDQDMSTPSPVMSPGIHFKFTPRERMFNSMSELNGISMPPLGSFPNQKINISKISSKLSTLKQHRDQRRALSDSDTFKCPVCNQMFLSFDNLAKHMAKHLPTETILQGENTKVHICKVCNKSFSRSDMLSRHMRLHTGIKPYECGECGQVFSRSDHLNTHKRTHTGEKPYRCPLCPYAACRRDMVTRHMKTHNKKSIK
ncbi:zinc finger protein 571-like [Mytilus trossulus]|uniref:zinc finger protein 571-like n=1 Tax=Mytilus trossulus TaxID=6551 RepID=UPI0030068467